MPVFIVDVEVTASARYYVDAEDEEAANQRAEEEADSDYPDADAATVVDCNESDEDGVPEWADVLEA